MADVEALRRSADRAKAAAQAARRRLDRAHRELKESEAEADRKHWAAERAAFDLRMAEQGYIPLPDGKQWLNPDYAKDHPEVLDKLGVAASDRP
jgi:hypothetical protein